MYCDTVVMCGYFQYSSISPDTARVGRVSYQDTAFLQRLSQQEDRYYSPSQGGFSGVLCGMSNELKTELMCLMFGHYRNLYSNSTRNVLFLLSRTALIHLIKWKVSAKNYYTVGRDFLMCEVNYHREVKMTNQQMLVSDLQISIKYMDGGFSKICCFITNVLRFRPSTCRNYGW